MGGAGSYSVAHRAGLLPTELTGVWGWILLRSTPQGRGLPPAPAPTEQRPGQGADGEGHTLLLQVLQQEGDVLLEAHVQDPIRLVVDDVPQGGNVEALRRPQVVHEPPGRADEGDDP